jgi:hypothetical protein
MRHHPPWEFAEHWRHATWIEGEKIYLLPVGDLDDEGDGRRYGGQAIPPRKATARRTLPSRQVERKAEADAFRREQLCRQHQLAIDDDR